MSPDGSSGARGAYRRADPLVLVMLRQILALPLDERWFVYRALAAKVERCSMKAADVCVLHLMASTTALGRPPSRPQYDAWRDEQPDRDAWMSSSAIRARFGGSWASARRSVQLDPEIDLAARRMGLRGGHFTRDQVISSLRKCLKRFEGRYVTVGEYDDWARRERETGSTRIPLTHNSAYLHFDSWLAALVEAGLSLEAAYAAPAAAVQHTDDELLAWVRTAATELDLSSAGRTGWKLWRERTEAAALADGALVCVPTDSKVARRFGSIAAAGIEAGVVPEDKRPAGNGPHTREEKLMDLRRATLELGVIPGARRYAAWRKRALASTSTDVPRRGVASRSAFNIEFDSWKDACGELVKRYPRLPGELEARRSHD